MKRILILSVVLILAACGGGRKSARMEGQNTRDIRSGEELEARMRESAFEFEYLSFKSQSHFTGMGMDQGFTMTVRMQRHEKVWISAQAVLGIEIARLLVTKDTVYFQQNFPETRYSEYSTDTLSQLMGIPFQVGQLQDLLVGNAIGSYHKAEIGLERDTLVAVKKLEEFLVKEFIQPGVAKIARMEMRSSRRSGNNHIYYADYQQHGNKQLPTKVNIFVDSPELNAHCELRYQNISLAPVSQFPFRVPKNR